MRRLGMGPRRTATMILVAAALVPGTAAGQAPGHDRTAWSKADLATLKSLWIGSLRPLPPDPSNAVADDPRAAQLGRRLFFDTRFSGDGQVACAICHVPGLAFTDGRKRGRGVGTTRRNTMTIVGAAYSPWFFWDGRKDSQWSQALGPMESTNEHGGTRTQYARLIGADARYRKVYQALFGPLPDLSDLKRFPPGAGPLGDAKARAQWAAMAPADRTTVTRVFVNVGKAIAAYERRLLPGPSRFDRYVAALLAGKPALARQQMSTQAVAGLRLFIGRGRCLRCHNGPLFTDFGFHNTGTPPAPGTPPDRGRIDGIAIALKDGFNCVGTYSDAGKDDCAELRFAKTKGADLIGALKTPTLRNVSLTGPYMDAGQFATLGAVLDHYNRAPAARIGKSEVTPLGLSPPALRSLRVFLMTLDSPPAVPAALLRPPE
jgi:cytochrome c peroxidase